MMRANGSLSQRVARNTLVLFLGQALSLLANLAVNIVLARYLGEDQFGAFSYALVLISFFALLADFGMKPILVRELARRPQESATILGNAFLLKIIFMSLALVLVLLVPLLIGFSSDLRTLVWILGGNLLLSAKLITVRIVWESVFHVHLRMEIPVLFQTLDALLLIVVIMIAISFNAMVQTLALVYVCCNLPGFVLTCIWSNKIVQPRMRWERDLVTMFLRESWPIALYLVFMAFYDRLDVLLLESMKGRSEVGLYAAAFRLVSPLNFIPLALATSLFPVMSKFSSSSSDKLRQTYITAIKILSTLGLLLALVASFFAEHIFAWLYPVSFAPAAKAFAYLMWAQALGFLNFYLVDFNASVNRQNLNLRAAFIMAAVNLGIDLLLIPQWGLMGASLAKIPTNVIGFVLLFAFSQPEDLKPLLKTVAKLMLVALSFGAVLSFIQGVHLLLALFVACLIYGGLIWLFRIFDAYETALFLRLLGRGK